MVEWEQGGTKFARRGLGVDLENQDKDFSLPENLRIGDIKQLTDIDGYSQEMSDLGWKVELENGVDNMFYKSKYRLLKPISRVEKRLEISNLLEAGLIDKDLTITNGWQVRNRVMDGKFDAAHSDLPANTQEYIDIKFEGFPTEETYQILMAIGPAFNKRSMFQRVIDWTLRS